MARITKARRSVAAKKAAQTRKRNAKKKKDKKTAKKAKAAGTKSERAYVTQLKKSGYDIVLNGKGIPDIIAHNKDGWKFFEVKPYKKKELSSNSWGIAGEKSRLLRPNQKKKFKELILKGQRVSMAYYTRKRGGSKTKPTYSFKYELVQLNERHFKRKKGPDHAELLD